MHERLAAGLLLSVILLMIPAVWLTFEKAGRPGWAGLMPFYNIYILCGMGGCPGWWVWLMVVPALNILVLLIIFHRAAQAFGYGIGMALLMLFMPLVAFPVLGFGPARYQAPRKPGDAAGA